MAVEITSGPVAHPSKVVLPAATSVTVSVKSERQRTVTFRYWLSPTNDVCFGDGSKSLDVGVELQSGANDNTDGIELKRCDGYRAVERATLTLDILDVANNLLTSGTCYLYVG